jgi:predicted molibdopterin-dependent oxidoreductase YjgC
MFRPLNDQRQNLVSVIIDGRQVAVPSGQSVAAAVLAHGLVPTRTTPELGFPRAPLCMMGVCFECLMVIDGQPNRQACQVAVTEGMRIERQQGTGADWPPPPGTVDD